MTLHTDLTVQRKLAALFDASPWLRDSKNIVHMPVLDPARDMKKEPSKTLPGVSWKELYSIILAQMRKEP